MNTKAAEPQRCWIGACAGCGRTLISATWFTGNGDLRSAALGYYQHKPVFCTRACRALHEHEVYVTSKDALERGTNRKIGRYKNSTRPAA